MLAALNYVVKTQLECRISSRLEHIPSIEIIVADQLPHGREEAAAALIQRRFGFAIRVNIGTMQVAAAGRHVRESLRCL